MSEGHSPPVERITPAQAAKRLGVSTSFLSELRRDPEGNGPVFYQLGRKIEYAIADLDAWLADRRRTTTARRLGPLEPRRSKHRDQQPAAA